MEYWEFEIRMEAAHERETQQRETAALMTAHLINALGHPKKLVTPGMLLGREGRPNRKRTTRRREWLTPEGREFARQQREQQAATAASAV